MAMAFYDSCVIDVSIIFGIMRRDYAKRQEERCGGRLSVSGSGSVRRGQGAQMREIEEASTQLRKINQILSRAPTTRVPA